MKVKRGDVVIDISEEEAEIIQKAMDAYAKSGVRLADKFPASTPAHKALMSDVARYRVIGARFSEQPEIGGM